MVTATLVDRWTDVCPLSTLIPERGVTALVNDVQVAVFLVNGELFAIANRDPFSNTNVMSRGIVGTRGGVVKVASPMYKQSFDLRSGICLDDDSVAIEVFPVRTIGGAVEVACPPANDAH